MPITSVTPAAEATIEIGGVECRCLVSWRGVEFPPAAPPDVGPLPAVLPEWPRRELEAAKDECPPPPCPS